MTFHATDQNDAALTVQQAVGISGPLPHSLIESCSINVSSLEILKKKKNRT